MARLAGTNIKPIRGFVSDVCCPIVAQSALGLDSGGLLVFDDDCTGSGIDRSKSLLLSCDNTQKCCACRTHCICTFINRCGSNCRIYSMALLRLGPRGSQGCG